MPARSPGARPTRGSAPTLAVVVPATDDPTGLERCLEALGAGSRAPDELIVQREPGGAGPAEARNRGAAAATAEVLVFVDSDVEVHPDALERLAARFAAEPALDAVFGAYDDDPADPGLASRYRNLLHHHVHSGAPGEAETFWAGLGAVRREAFEAVDGFDAARFPAPSVEDIELGMRLRRRGARIALDPEIRGRHLKAWTARTMVATDFGRRGVPWVRLLLRDGSGSTALNLGWRRRANAASSLALLGSLLARRPRLAAAALLANLLLDRELYALLARRGGPRLLAAGIGLHQAHQLAAAAAVPAALALHFAEGGR
ncbi:MAG TPA: glycosyltransferase family A protein [Solirubrobacterales bacterium]|nr:glycosyltransferase family A protein [Solirubrobacterales bacterium]